MHRSLISAAILALLGFSTIPAIGAGAEAPLPAAIGSTDESPTTTQLPRNVVPSHYRLSLMPDAANATFEARVTITVEVTQATPSITLNAAGLAFASATIATTGAIGAGQPRPASGIDINPAQQSATFHFAEALAKGSYQLTLAYSGKIGSQAEGLFALDYDSDHGRRRALYTQFENSDARRMLPSWDEPAYKATFALDVTAPAGQLAISNMPVARSQTLADGRQQVQFATTPKMSTYLLFFGLGEFERASAMADGTEIGVLTKPGALEQSRFALDSASGVLREYNDYFGVRYPLPKLDNIAAPGRSQFFGAMENWGAIFTFESSMLLDPTISTQTDKQRIYQTLAHEMAHQWFGDLVTMRWWDDLWLNEGFASWMENRTTAKLHPEWHTALGAISVREAAMERDAVASTHPVVQQIATVEQASQAFDNITYAKGESVIRMLEAYTGEAQWRQGVRAYMQAHAYDNTVSDDLWRQIDAAGGKPVTAIAHQFTLQPGVPMISVGAVQCRAGRSHITLTQGEFSKDQPNRQPLSWSVPVVLQELTSGAKASVLVTGGKAQLIMPGCGPVLVNAGQNGYFRTRYAAPQVAALVKRYSALAPIDQIGLLADNWALGLAGQQPISAFLDLADAVAPGADAQVWGKVASVFSAINDQYQADPARRRQFAAYATARLAPVLKQLGWSARTGEGAPAATLRNQLIEVLSDLNEAAVIAEARRRYGAAAADPAALPAALRKTILGVIAKHADAATWERLLAQARSETAPLVKSQLYDLLAATDDQALARRALTLAMTDEVGVTNSPAMLSRVSHTHPELAFDFALANLSQVTPRIDSSSRTRYLPRLASRSADPATIVKLKSYAQAHLPAGAHRDADTAVLEIEYRIKVRRQRLPEIDAWLARQHPGKAG